MTARALAILMTLAAVPAGEAIEVRVLNASRPTSCAEHDNVDLRFVAPATEAVGSLRVEAAQPIYAAEIMADSTAPDWRDCPPEGHGRSDYPFEPRQLVLFEDARLRLVGIAFDRFWRPETPPVRVGAREERGLHLLQLWWKVDGVDEEVVAFYPGDGYWRLRPLPLPRLDDSVYGSSLLIGPIGDYGRPVVELASIAFDPERLAFDVAFAAGGTARLAFTEPNRERLGLDVAFDPPAPAGVPFAAVRSMYVNRYRADAAELSWRVADGAALRTEPIMAFATAEGGWFRIGRQGISTHNTSAPDLLLDAFTGAGG